MITRFILLESKGRSGTKKQFIPRICPITLIALLFTIVVMFSLKGEYIVELPLDVVRIAVPLLIYFVVMFLVTFWMGPRRGPSMPSLHDSFLHCRQQQLRAGHCRGRGGLRDPTGEAFAAVIGPLVEVPVLISLVNVALRFREKYFRPVCAV